MLNFTFMFYMDVYNNFNHNLHIVYLYIFIDLIVAISLQP